ncbi:MAG: hypothetical protein HYZ81_24405 [Nitrospinae bacterium]|nr:hypothetical protein [Nitrospinota bacterium]
MQRRLDQTAIRFLAAILTFIAVLAPSGCVFKPAYLQGEKTDVPHRWKVEQLEIKGLSDDQRATLEQRGPPTFVRFFRAVQTRDPVFEWIYIGQDDSVELVWFAAGKRVEDVAVDSDPSAFRSTTRRRARIALLVGAGAAIVPAVVLLANR